VEEFTWGPVRLEMRIEPGKVDLTRGVELTLTVESPPEIDVEIPSLNDRVQGFAVRGRYDDEPVQRDGKTVRVVHTQLIPLVAERYRIAPMAIGYTDKAAQPPRQDWFTTRPLVLEAVALTKGDPGREIEAQVDPVWIRPPFRTVVWWILGVLLAAGGVYGLWRLVSRVRESIEVARMSPRERALRELGKLLARELIRKQKIKEFYLELTMIVRRYIERRHGVRAPEQTTEEFLAAISSDIRFSAAVLAKLRDFLRASDLVKFAADRPDEESIGRATETAKDYIEHDAADAGPEKGGA
jgi:hypothetical protein